MAKHKCRIEQIEKDRGKEVGERGAVRSGGELGIAIQL